MTFMDIGILYSRRAHASIAGDKNQKNWIKSCGVIDRMSTRNESARALTSSHLKTLRNLPCQRRLEDRLLCLIPDTIIGKHFVPSCSTQRNARLWYTLLCVFFYFLVTFPSSRCNRQSLPHSGEAPTRFPVPESSFPLRTRISPSL